MLLPLGIPFYRDARVIVSLKCIPDMREIHIDIPLSDKKHSFQVCFFALRSERVFYHVAERNKSVAVNQKESR